MADGFPITPGVGGKAATDDCGAAGHAQIIKLAIDTDGSAALIPATTDGLLVNLGANNDVTVAGVSTSAKQDSIIALLAGGFPAALAAGGGLKVEGVAGGVAVPISLTTLPAGTNNIGDVDVLTINGVAPAFGSGVRGATVQRVTIATDDSVAVTGTVTANLAAGTNNIGDVDVLTLPSLPAGANNIGDVDVLTLPALAAGTNYVGKVRITDGTNDLAVDTSWADAESNTQNHLDVGAFNMMYNGTTWDRVRGDTTNGLDVDVTRVPAPLSTTGNGTAATALRVTVASDSTGTVAVTQGTATNLKAQAENYQGGTAVGAANPLQVTLANGSVPSHAVTNAGTFAVQVDGSALTSLQLIDDVVVADDATFTPGTTKVAMSGGYVVAHGSNPDAADAGDAGAILMNRHRVAFTIGGHPNVVTLKHTTITTAVTDAAIVTVSTGTKIVVTRLTATLDTASTVFPTCLIGFGSTNTPTTTGVLASHGGIPAGGGFNIGDGSGIIGIGADGEDLRVTTTGNATGNGLQICVSYYTIES